MNCGTICLRKRNDVTWDVWISRLEQWVMVPVKLYRTLEEVPGGAENYYMATYSLQSEDKQPYLLVYRLTPVAQYLEDLNHIYVAGNVGHDTEIKYTERSTIGNNSIAVNRGRDVNPTWVKVTFWNKTAETAARYVQKGKFIAVAGELQISEYQDRATGETCQSLSISVQELTLGPRVDSEPSQARSQAPSHNRELVGAGAGNNYEDIPF